MCVSHASSGEQNRRTRGLSATKPRNHRKRKCEHANYRKVIAFSQTSWKSENRNSAYEECEIPYRSNYGIPGINTGIILFAIEDATQLHQKWDP